MEILTFWETISQYQIRIPELQRDYAQGRDDVKSADIRDKFLTALHISLKNQKPLHLDFIYGTVEKAEGVKQENFVSVDGRERLTISRTAEGKKDTDQEYFVPIDGQQRLTTLFLLHYYFMPVNQDSLDRFSYATRPTSAAFCKQLVTHKLSRSKLPAEEIKDAIWYNPEWDFDPTVAGILIMLDAIHGKFKEEMIGWEALTNDRLITFHFLDMKAQGLSKDLYIKMNSRGKQLTNWENFKADLEKFVELDPKVNLDKKWTESENGSKDWKELIDTEWTDIFWANRDDKNYLVDEEWLRFLKGMALICYAKQNKGVIDPDHKELISRFAKRGDGYFSINDFEQIGFLTEENLNYTFTCLELIKNQQVLDKFESALDRLELNIDRRKFLIFKRNVGDEAGLRSRLYLFAFFEGIRITREDPLNQTTFLSWMRVWRNLLQNTEYENNEARFCNAVNSIHLVSKKWEADRNFAQSFIEIDSILDGFDKPTFEEEVQKLKILSEDPARYQELELKLLKAENNEVLQGRVKFLLEISKNGDFIDFDLLDHYTEKFNAVFSLSALSGKGEKLPDHLLHRAMLSQYDYSCEIRRGNVFNYGYGNRNIWIRILYQKNFEKLKLFLNQIDIHNVEASLGGLIDTYNQFDYRYLLIKNPSIFGKTHLNQIWWKNWPKDPNNSNDYINLELVLMSKDWLSGANWELFTFSLFQEYQSKVKLDETLLLGIGPAKWDSENYFREKGQNEDSYVYWEVLKKAHLVVYYKPEYYPTNCFKLVVKEVDEGGNAVISKFELKGYETEIGDGQPNRPSYSKMFTYDGLWNELNVISEKLVLNTSSHVLQIPAS